MKLPDIPDKYKERRIFIMAGTELAAFKHPNEDFWRIKETSCNLCGECCMDYPNSPYGNDDEGKCNKLVRYGDTWECGALDKRPWNCLGDPVNNPHCCITHRKEKAE